MKIETVNRESLLRAFNSLKDEGITTIRVDTVIDIIRMFTIIRYDPEEVFKDERL